MSVIGYPTVEVVIIEENITKTIFLTRKNSVISARRPKCKWHLMWERLPNLYLRTKTAMRYIKETKLSIGHSGQVLELRK